MKLRPILVEQATGPKKPKAPPNQKSPYEKRESGVVKKIQDSRDIVSLTDLTTLEEYPDNLMKKWKETIIYASKTPEWKWKNALQLVDWTMINSGIDPTDDIYGVRPSTTPKRWQQYLKLVSYGVNALADARGRRGEWRMSEPVGVTESINPVTEGKFTGKYRYFISMPGVEDEEVHDAKSMDEVIEPIQNKLRRYGKKARIAHRTEQGAILKVYDTEDQPAETIYIKQFPSNS